MPRDKLAKHFVICFSPLKRRLSEIVRRDLKIRVAVHISVRVCVAIDRTARRSRIGIATAPNARTIVVCIPVGIYIRIAVSVNVGVCVDVGICVSVDIRIGVAVAIYVGIAVRIAVCIFVCVAVAFFTLAGFAAVFKRLLTLSLIRVGGSFAILQLLRAVSHTLILLSLKRRKNHRAGGDQNKNRARQINNCSFHCFDLPENPVKSY